MRNCRAAQVKDGDRKWWIKVVETAVIAVGFLLLKALKRN